MNAVRADSFANDRINVCIASNNAVTDGKPLSHRPKRSSSNPYVTRAAAKQKQNRATGCPRKSGHLQFSQYRLEILQLKIPAVDKFNVNPTNCLFSVFSYITYHCHFQEIIDSCHSN